MKESASTIDPDEQSSSQSHARVSERVLRSDTIVQRMRQEITLLHAAGCISRSSFPRAADLPTLEPLPRNNLGHELLLDYDQLCACTWSVARSIRAKVGNPAPASVAAIGALIATGMCWYVGSRLDAPLAGFGIGLAAGLAVFIWLYDNWTDILLKSKIDALERILNGQVPPQAATFSSSRSSSPAQCGSGLVSSTRPPVFFATTGQNHFPGLGALQVSQTFLCSANDSLDRHPIDGRELHRAISKIAADVAGSGIGHAVSGYAVVVDARSVWKDSAWLDAHGRPLLYLDGFDDPFDVPLRDPRAVARAYVGIQVFLPERLTCVGLFIRPFVAGRSAAFEVRVVTLGPPSPSRNDIVARLAHYRTALERDTAPKPKQPSNLEGKKGVALNLRLLRGRIDLEIKQLAIAHGANDLAELELDGKDNKEEHLEAELLQAQSSYWIGTHTAVANWRESNSLTLTNDFFGAAESKAVVRAIYDQMVQSTLEAMEKMGFKVEQYRDSTGRWTINAEKIESMVVGEQITIATKTGTANEKLPASETPKSGEKT